MIKRTLSANESESKTGGYFVNGIACAGVYKDLYDFYRKVQVHVKGDHFEYFNWTNNATSSNFVLKAAVNLDLSFKTKT